MRELIWRLLRWLFPQRPSPVTGLRLSRTYIEGSVMSNVRLSWVLPVPTNRQRPLSHVHIETRVSLDLPWTEIATVDAPGTELVIQDVAPGSWMYRAIVIDNGSNESVPVSVGVTVDFDDPSPVTGFTAEVV